MSKVDLHIHTTASDGKYSPAEIVTMASEKGLLYIAICDHDSIEGVLPAQQKAADFPEMKVIGGVEINTDISSGELHILGYFYDYKNRALTNTLEQLRNSRIERAVKMIKKLKNMGIKIDYERVREIAGTGSIGRPHIAEAMLERGYVISLREAFDKYIGRGCPAYVERDKITPIEATKLIIGSGGIPVLAHPLTFDKPEALIEELKGAGLLGLEVYYNGYSPEKIEELLRLADKYNLIATGGSDFHGLDSNAEPPLGTVEVPLESALRLMALVNR